MNITEQIKAIAAKPKLTFDDIQEIKRLLSDPKSASKPNTDKRTIDDLRSTIKALADQIKATNTATITQDTDDLLDKLYIKTVSRTHEIESKGISVTFNTSERTFKALQVNEGTLYFIPGTPITIGTHVKAINGGLSIITDIKQVAGRIECGTWTPSTTCQSYSKTATATGYNLKKEGTNVSCQYTADTLTTFNVKYAINTILKLYDRFYEVVGIRQEGQLVSHKLKLYQDQKQKQTVNRSGVADTELPRNYSMYHNAII